MAQVTVREGTQLRSVHAREEDMGQVTSCQRRGNGSGQVLSGGDTAQVRSVRGRATAQVSSRQRRGVAPVASRAPGA